MDEIKTERVQHRQTGATGTVLSRWENTSPYAGDLAGPWAQVRFDDGLECSVPEAELVPEAPAEPTADRPEWRFELRHFRFADQVQVREHDLRERVAYFDLGVRANPHTLRLENLGREVRLPVEALEELLRLLDHHGRGRCTGPVPLAKAEAAAWQRGYDTGYSASREDATDGFDARGDEEE